MGHVRSKTRSPGQILENSFFNITSDVDPQVSPVVYNAIKKGNSLKSSLSGERSRALWALLFISSAYQMFMLFCAVFNLLKWKLLEISY